jgi:peptidoglycan/xylan/chitin deacetylase (PgdA/CDA1 family)
MEIIGEAHCNVLPLSEALNRLQNRTLPDRSVAITFDDGLHDFFSAAFPTLQSFGYPVTLYLTTYYVEFNRPVFDPMCSYLLWKGRHKGQLEWPGVFRDAVILDDEGRRWATTTIKQFAASRKLSGQKKDELLAELAGRLGVDYEDLCRKRVLHLITAEEAKSLALRGVEIQYHTHRHRMHRTSERMFAELQDNRCRIALYTPREPRHFCYTGGFYLPQHPAYLKEYGISSATTCFSGLCSPQTDRMLLPRVLDDMQLSDLEFRAWLTGARAFLPVRPVQMSEGQLSEEDGGESAK